jgi:transcriptional regulator with XRE-family HTH domain
MRAFDTGTRLAARQGREIGEEFRERRLQLNQSQEEVARACQMSRVHYGQVENGRVEKLTLVDIHHVAAALGLTPSIRVYPAGAHIRDIGQASRLQQFLAPAAAPLSYRLEVSLPRVDDRLELRAWDAVLFGRGARTAIELEMRLRDVQAMRRRIDLKRRDDPTASFLLLIADTRANRRILAEFVALFTDLPRLRPGDVRARLLAGEHPVTGLLLV